MHEDWLFGDNVKALSWHSSSLVDGNIFYKSCRDERLVNFLSELINALIFQYAITVSCIVDEAEAVFIEGGRVARAECEVRREAFAEGWRSI